MTGRLALPLIALLLLASLLLQVRRDQGWHAYQPTTPLLWFQHADVVKRGALGFDSLVADLYWIRAVVYYGRQRLSDERRNNYDLLYPLLNLVTTLDPGFSVAYRFGAIFLCEAAPGGPGRPDQAIALLERGASYSPQRWEYLHDLGFVHAFGRRDYQQAAASFQRASEISGAPPWLKSTAASMAVRGGDRAVARQLWQQLYDQPENEWFKRTAEIHLAQFDALEAIDQLNQLVWRHQGRTGRMPSSWQELIAAGVLTSVPADPAGVPFEIDPVNQDVELSKQSPLWPFPEGYTR